MVVLHQSYPGCQRLWFDFFRHCFIQRYSAHNYFYSVNKQFYVLQLFTIHPSLDPIISWVILR